MPVCFRAAFPATSTPPFWRLPNVAPISFLVATNKLDGRTWLAYGSAQHTQKFDCMEEWMSGGKSAALPNRDAALRGLYDDVARGNMFPFWATSADVENDEIKQLMGTKKAVPFMWDYAKDIEPLLHRAAELIKMDDSERRSLILINP